MKYLKVILFAFTTSLTTISCQQEDIVQPKNATIESADSPIAEEEDDDIPTCGEGC